MEQSGLVNKRYFATEERPGIIASNDGIKKRYFLLGLSAITFTFVGGLSYSCMPVLFDEVADELGLNLVQLGSVWSMLGLASATVAMMGGILGDKFGIKRVLALVCILGALFGASRGLAYNFITITITMFAYGLIRGIIGPNVHKVCGLWFEKHNLAKANAVVAMGMGIGLMISPLISATLLSPWLGGWRNVMFLYGGGCLVVGLLWLFSGKMPAPIDDRAEPVETVPFGQAIFRLLRLKEMWLLGLALMFRMGCITGTVGYLPLYLVGQGWDSAAADGTLTALYGASTLFVLPVSVISDKTGARKVILVIALITSIFSVGLIPLVGGNIVWLLVLVAGMLVDTYIIITITMTQEIRELKPAYYGAAVGFVFTLAEIGNFIAPLVGNSLASLDPGLPLLFWAFLSVVAVVILAFVRVKPKLTFLK